MKLLGTYNADTDYNIVHSLGDQPISLAIGILATGLNNLDGTVTIQTSFDNVNWADVIDGNGNELTTTIDANELHVLSSLGYFFGPYLRIKYVKGTDTTGTLKNWIIVKNQ